MAKLFGGEAIEKYAKELDVTINPAALQKFVGEPTMTFEECVTRGDLAAPGLVDLMKRLLTLDYTKRPSAREALAHPFFQ
jgi:serine/threonine protein kinase